MSIAVVIFLIANFFMCTLQTLSSHSYLDKVKMIQNYDMQSYFSSVQFSHSVESDLCDPMNCRMQGLPVHHQPPEFIQTHVH